ncbi:hypothetical protein [Marimonas arenosa]|uniref:V-type ATP synthase subunit I n=1 Tax=Marimonas arenosa TaxID=1795305 RepID=A0AAE3WGG8_9RHOB|nr:hypothetical protein [Marimonas arenosa]MDQ2092189.1 hypothetical protein [Marimonas arenosa]
MLRARATHWFEIITTQRDMAAVMQVLAETGAVELEAHPLQGVQPVLPQLDAFFEEFAALEKKYGRYWPPREASVKWRDEEPAALLERILENLRVWVKQAGPAIEDSQRFETRAGELKMLRDLVEAAGGFPFAGLPADGAGILARAIYHVKAETPAVTAPGGLLVQGFPARDGEFLVAIGEARDMATFRGEMAALRARELHLPEVVADDRAKADADPLAGLDAALAENAAEERAARDRIEVVSRALGLGDMLARVALFRWLREHRANLQGTDWTLRITGWIDPDQARAVEAALDAAGVDTVLSLGDANAGQAPMLLSNPGWLKPFEFFPRLLGMPGAGEADPSLVTALIAPLMFGYMFGDVGQGAVLLAIGLWGRKQYPLLALLVPGGVMAMVFGLLFGSVFSREDILPALWLHPLQEPLTVLGVALAMGIVFLLGGVLLDAVQAVWTGRLKSWLYANTGIMLAYLAVLAAFFEPALIWGVPLGLVLAVAGARDETGQMTAGAVARALGEYLESLMRLLVSSVSFSRVGAFALAHAGLSAAIVGMADAAAGAVGLVVLVLGNVLIIALEGLVTGIQITRLVLFEFFTRFFKAGGREFHPLSFPDHDFSAKNGDAT